MDEPSDDGEYEGEYDEYEDEYEYDGEGEIEKNYEVNRWENSLERLEIMASDLPSKLTAEELDDYLSWKYPNKYVYIYHSPITKFGNLPPELIAKILQSDKYLASSSTKINRNIRSGAITNIYQTECQKPISAKEILDHIMRFDDQPREIKYKEGNFSSVIYELYGANKEYRTKNRSIHLYRFIW